MGLMDAIKGAAQAVMNAVCDVNLELEMRYAYPGDKMTVWVNVRSKGTSALTIGGVFVDLMATEIVRLKATAPGMPDSIVLPAQHTFQQSFPLVMAFQLAPGERKEFKGEIQIPPTALPTYVGPRAEHTWAIRARADMAGNNDPESGWRPLQIASRPGF